MLLEVGMAVVPGDELGRGPRAGQVLAGDPEPPVGLRADGVDDRVVQRSELGGADRLARRRRSRRTGTRARLAVFSKTRETALISGWSGATPRRTSPHGVGSRSIRSTCRAGREQRRGGVEPGRAGADDGDAQGLSAQQPAGRDRLLVLAPPALRRPTWKLWPQPHEPEAFGLSTLNPDSWSDSTKSTVAPLRYCALAGSTTTVTP